MLKNLVILTILFYFLTLLQTSFLVHFSIKGVVINLILIALFLINILEIPEKNIGVVAAGISGLFWDIFSEKFIGYHILILVLFALLIKIILVRYVRIKIFAPR